MALFTTLLMACLVARLALYLSCSSGRMGCSPGVSHVMAGPFAGRYVACAA